MLNLEILNEGIAAMLTGMITVFFFLSVLWAVVFALGKVITALNTLFPDKTKTEKKNDSSDVEIAVSLAVAARK